MPLVCCMAFSVTSCYCRISAETKAFQLQRQVDTVKSEKLRVENGVCVCRERGREKGRKEGRKEGRVNVCEKFCFFTRT